MNRHLNNEGHECKTGLIKGRELVGGTEKMGSVRKDEYG
jgi:hypothetical protein